ncbi:MAG: sigma-54 dependent transcriptional regulator [Desulfotignum sp.]|nr:sigma-54 dependent transcriptional regulator [Desulfotignum sp.]MCF8089613.1 sigma-54 dependent transcriptional regulator [Desulfotignum sp.]
MKKILYAWMGLSDVKAFETENRDDTGPIAAALKSDVYVRAVIFSSDLLNDRVQDFGEWLKTFCNHPIHVNTIKTGLTDPTDFKAIYIQALDGVKSTLKTDASSIRPVFHTSAGTGSMGIIWLLLQHRFDAVLIKSSREHGVTELTFPFNLSANLIEEGTLRDAGYQQGIIHESAVMKRLIEKATNCAPLSRPVLIEGSSGTGKEMIAKLIHEHRFNLAKGNFIPINCGAIPRELVESELFGHVRGAFTGADQIREGKIEQARGGTLFLDEIGEMPLDVQTKLLRVLQDKTVLKIGDHPKNARKIDFRLVAATNRKLVQEVAQGNFREDLYYRINVIYLKTPSLKERGPDEIHLLARHFLKDINHDFRRFPGYKEKTLSKSAIDLLQSYSWPGNIRELFNVLYRAVFEQPRDPVISDTHIQEAIGIDHPVKKGEEQELLKPLEKDTRVDLDGLIEKIKEQYVRQALELSRGSVTVAAKMLGKDNSQSLYPLMKNLGIDHNSYKIIEKPA